MAKLLGEVGVLLEGEGGREHLYCPILSYTSTLTPTAPGATIKVLLPHSGLEWWGMKAFSKVWSAAQDRFFLKHFLYLNLTELGFVQIIIKK